MPESEEYKMKEIKFKVGTYEFSVKARCTVLNDKYNTRDTLYMMNMLSVVLDELANGYHEAYKATPEKGISRPLGRDPTQGKRPDLLSAGRHGIL